MEKEKKSSNLTNTEPSSFKLLASCPSGLSPSQVYVEFGDAYDRIPHSDLTLENSISEIWEQRSVQNKSLFNGNKFRYGGHVLHTGGESDNEPHVCLHLGLTDYRLLLSAHLGVVSFLFIMVSDIDMIGLQ
ncbi:nudix hydrolase 9-like [Vicia villosa]|uniref:nudix hydrolase 9-like n=1 Tax=Vicia villosa TaxID=3911 RepID=UPI00273B533C|nr:nudix hydrolase 9-like [Vicia villosa]